MRRHTAQLFSWTAGAVGLLGLILRLSQYLANSSMWVDEAALARNILDRSPSALFGPLDYGQVGPPGFLLSVKITSTLLGPNEFALRLIPFVAGVAAIALFFTAARMLSSPVSRLVAVLMFSVAVPLVFQSSNLKPYSSDVAIALAIVSTARAVHGSSLTARRAVGLAALGIAGVFFSQAAVFSVTAAGVALIVDAIRDRDRDRSDRWLRVAVALSWAIAVIVAATYSARTVTAADNEYLHRFWSGAFMPAQPVRAIDWLLEMLRAMFGSPGGVDPLDGAFHYAWPMLFVVLLLAGTAALLYMTPSIGILIVGPIAFAAAASAAGVYPFGVRVTLFMTPLFILLVVHGADVLGKRIAGPTLGERASLLLVPIAIAACVAELPPRRPEHTRPVIRYIADRWQPGDALWVYYGAGQAFEYYRRMIPMTGDVEVGYCARDNPRAYLRQLDRLRGRSRAWILFSHAVGVERRLLLEYLDTIGVRREEFHAPADDRSSLRGATLLYDLSDAGKRAVASAETFPIGFAAAGPQWTCYGTMSPVAIQ